MLPSSSESFQGTLHRAVYRIRRTFLLLHTALLAVLIRHRVGQVGCPGTNTAKLVCHNYLALPRKRFWFVIYGILLSTLELKFSHNLVQIPNLQISNIFWNKTPDFCINYNHNLTCDHFVKEPFFYQKHRKIAMMPPKCSF